MNPFLSPSSHFSPSSLSLQCPSSFLLLLSPSFTSLPFSLVLPSPMAVDLMAFPKIDDQTAIQEAASQGLKSMEHLIRILSTNQQSNQLSNYTDLADHTVDKFQKVISLLNRTGHARFRRGPAVSSNSSSSASTNSSTVSFPHSQAIPLTPTPFPSPTPLVVAPTSNSGLAGFVQSQQQSMTLDFTKPNVLSSNVKSTELEFTKESFSVSSSSSLMSTAITGDGSVSNGKLGPSIFFAPATAVSGGKPPLSAGPYKKRCHDHDHSEDLSLKFSGPSSASGKCHCSKRRYCVFFI